MAAAAVLLFAGRAQAYRPFDGTDADTAELREFELELGPVQYYRLGSQNYLVAPAMVLNYGILDRTELVIDANQFIAVGDLEPGVSRVSFLADDVLMKYVFRKGTLQGESGPSIAAEGGLLTPEVNGVADFGASLDVITSYRWPFGTVHWNEWFQYNREHRPELFTGAILEGPHGWTVRPVAEFFYDTDFAGDTLASGLVGAIWTVTDSLALDAGIRGALTEGTYLAEARLGLTWSIVIGRGEKPEIRSSVPGPARR